MHADDILQVPCPSCRAALGALRTYTLTTRPDVGKKKTARLALLKRGSDIVIPGLGWITLFGDPFEGTLHTPKLIEPTVRRRLIGDLSRVTP
jgi:30S ribosome assembly GTPase